MSYIQDEDTIDDFLEEKQVTRTEKEYDIYSFEELLEMQSEQISNISENLNIGKPIARILLRFYSWNVEKILNLYFENDLAWLFRKANISENKMTEEDPNGEFECPTCIDDVKYCDSKQNMCGHWFCNACWNQHITIKLKEGNSTRIPCMNPKCGVHLDEMMIFEFLSLEDKTSFSRKIAESVVEESDQLRWCGSTPSCGNVAFCPNKGSMAQVYCTCGFQFCFQCGKEPHVPCTCKMMAEWEKKSSQDSMNAIYFKEHCKACPNPKCGKLIEKNGGCNHMNCSSCKTHFCYVCLGPFDHVTYKHTCGKAPESGNGSDLRRYLFYYERFAAHQDSRRKEVKTKENVKKKMDNLFLSTGGKCLFDITWLDNAANSLFTSRRVLQFSYAMAFYMFDLCGSNTTALQGVRNLTKDELKSAKGLFENLQETLENVTENLSALIEKDVEELSKTKNLIMSKAIEAEKKTHALVDTIKNEILDISFGFNVPSNFITSKSSTMTQFYTGESVVPKEEVKVPVKVEKRKIEKKPAPRKKQKIERRVIEVEEPKEEIDMTEFEGEDMDFLHAIERSMYDK